jgi:ribosomal protein S18 acetylase RimI-like enzyme
MRIRPGLSEDLPAIERAELSAGTLFEGTHMDWAIGDTTLPADLREGIANGTLWVAEVDGLVTGFLLGEAIGEHFHIWEIAVSRELQGRGIGLALVETALAAAAGRGLKQATLTTDRSLPWNAPWYLRLGFTIAKEADAPRHLSAQLDSEPRPNLRCAMVRKLAA